MVGSAAETDSGFLGQETTEEAIDEEDEDEAASWLLLNPMKNSNGSSNNQNNNGLLYGGEMDEYLDFVEYNSCPENQLSDQYSHNQQQQPPPQHYGGPHKNYGGDSVVPVQCREGKGQLQQHHQQQGFNLGVECEYESTKASYGYNPSISHSVSFFFTTP